MILKNHLILDICIHFVRISFHYNIFTSVNERKQLVKVFLDDIFRRCLLLTADLKGVPYNDNGKSQPNAVIKETNLSTTAFE